MSKFRCGLQISRDKDISRTIHNHPKKTQVRCQIERIISQPVISEITDNTAEEELEDQRERSAQMLMMEPQDISELALEKTLQSGKGIIGKLANILPVKQIASSVAAGISNLFPNSDENARKIFPGEKHAIVKLPNNKFGRASYTGPGTRVIARLKREAGGDPPRVLSDKVSQAHDIRYSLAENEDEVREADLKMLRSLKRLKREKTDRNININPAMLGIRGKILSENFGLLSRNAFIDVKDRPSASDRKLLRDKLDMLEQQGFGQRGAVRGVIGHNEGESISSVAQGKISSRITQRRPMKKQIIADFKGPKFLGPSGVTSTQSLAGIYSKNRGVQLDRRMNRTFEAIQANSGKNTKAAFRNRVSMVTQSGGGTPIPRRIQDGRGQEPGNPAGPASQMINIKTKGHLLKSGVVRGAPLGSGFPGVNPVDVQTGSGRNSLTPSGISAISKLPGIALLKKMNKKVSASRGGRVKMRKPLFMDEKAMSRIMADQLLPMVLA